MDALSVFILTTAIGVGTSRAPASQTDDAYKAIIKASYIQTGTDKQVKRFEKKYIRYLPKEMVEYGGWITGAAKMINEQKISYEWTF